MSAYPHPHAAYDALTRTNPGGAAHNDNHDTLARLRRCHPDFRVVALGLPVPPFRVFSF